MLHIYRHEKKEETENSKKQSDTLNTPPKNSITQRCGPTYDDQLE